MKNKALVLFIAVIAAVFLTIYFLRDVLLVSIIAKQHSLRISYSNISRDKEGFITFKNLSVYSDTLAIGINSSDAKIKISSIINMPRKIEFLFHKLKFDEPPKSSITESSLLEIAVVPFKNKWVYDTVSGSINEGNDKYVIKSLEASGSDIRIGLTGTIFINSVVDLNLKLFVSGQSIAELPLEASDIILNDEEGGWKSISMAINGNLSAPSVSITGKLFRLNIKEVPN